MYPQILIATDGSDLANNGVNQGLAFAKALGSKVTIVMVTEEWSDGVAKVLETAAAAAAKLGVAAETVHMVGEHPAEGIVETAEKKGCSCIVMASHGRRGLRRLMLGSQTAEVVVSSRIPVLVIR